MKVASFAAVALSFFSVTVAGQESEDPGPSPTESVGCEPHGDHWHCEGPAETSMTMTTSSVDEAESTSVDPGPSPTSADCEPHGDHWHCADPTETDEPSGGVDPTETPKPSGGADEDDEDDEDDSSESEDPGPSPTESIGCEPHGDHWHCEGPATATSVDGPVIQTETGAAAALGFDSYSVAGVVFLAALFPAI